MAPSAHSNTRSNTASPAQSNNTGDMTRSPSAEPSKTTKRKGTRSVSTLTPSQLARKRANDREAQRAIRARTKEHIERLERELEELKSKQSRDETVQDLLKRNKALEKELRSLRETMGIQTSQHSYSTPDGLSLPNSGVPSSTASPLGQHAAHYKQSPDFTATSYMPSPEPVEAWASQIPCSMPSTTSSPSSTSHIEEYNGYIPTSAPPLVDGASVAHSNMAYPPEVKYEEYERIDNGEILSLYPRCHFRF
ncbi:putative bzip transcription factor protein [Phaeoacremonium minimum UCRPA7]|uniref:Putative bzip transcription factor protein n=1 Tax=Phaeoacremonium minimum (strain UCR-PA7) TaxID=1286976 RepID=R8BVZ1_PHAM7|nr:putative bzip transcription factor protein [Phaeoacremonium minimum UCRPA7]EOO03469.1 putative bzip transcription factor protein [Phaeoacremonium minimum UCRPA7]